MTKLQRTADSPFPTPRTRSLVLGFRILSAGWILGSWSFAAAASAPSSSPPPEPPALSRIVTRLSTAATRTARDWAELGRETVTWGSRLQSEQQPVPEGPVRDALAAVDLGSKQDPKTADWPKLRQELEALLKKPEDDQQQQQQQQNQQQNQQDKKDQQQKNQQDQPQNQDQQKQDQQKQDQSQQQQDPQQSQQQSSQQNDQNQPKQEKQNQQSDQSAFGDMKEPPPAPPPQETQKVGGVPEKKEGQSQPTDPSLALPLQKLDQLKNQDSPAELFKLMEGEKDQTPRKNKKDW